MAIAYSSAGAGVVTEASGGDLAPACPATVNANDILIAHVMYEGNATTPSTPAGWTLLYGPVAVNTAATGRAWVFGKIAAGDEDGDAISFGTPAVTTVRVGRIYSFTGWSSGTITELCVGFSNKAGSATTYVMPQVGTSIAGSLPVAFLSELDDNAMPDATGESGGNWTNPVATYLQSATTPDTGLGLQTCALSADPGAVTAGTTLTGAADPYSIIGFEIRPSVPSPILSPYAGVSAKAESTTTAVLCNLPSTATAGAIVFLVCATGAGGTVTITNNGTVTDWTLLFDVSETGADDLWVFVGTIPLGTDTGAMTGPTIQASINHICAGTLMLWIPGISTAWVHAEATGSEATSDTSFSWAPGVATEGDNARCLVFYTNTFDSSTAQGGTATNATLASVGEQLDYNTASGEGGGFTVAAGILATAGSVGTWAATLANASPKTYAACAVSGNIPPPSGQLHIAVILIGV